MSRVFLRTVAFFHQPIKQLSTVDKRLLGVKVLTLAIMLGAAFVGHPPSGAQVPNAAWQVLPTSPEDVKQDSDISHNSDAIKAHTDDIKALTLIVTDQGKDNARLDTKITMLFLFLSALQTGTIVYPLMQKKKEG